jgi:hypothetical protein
MDELVRVAFIWLSLKDDLNRIVSLRIDDVHWFKEHAITSLDTPTMTTTLDIALPHHAVAIAPFHCVSNRTPFALPPSQDCPTFSAETFGF